MKVAARFEALLANLTLTDDQKKDGEVKHAGVRKCLNSYYFGSSSETENSLLVGSWGKGTRIRPPRDIDILFSLPSSVYDRYTSRPGNKQSQLLQEVKNVLAATYASTDMRADGQVVVVPFSSFAVEVVPAFKLTDGKYWICDTNSGGSYKKFDPVAEKKNIADSNESTNNNTRDLIRMLKRWQYYCSVPLKSFWLELLAIKFLGQWPNKGKSTVYYDWMIRDFFEWLCNQKNSYHIVPGTYEVFGIGDSWHSRAESALIRARKGCEYELSEKPYSAGTEWQKIFGDFIPTG